LLTTDPYTWGTGRRKSSVARVRIKSGGSGQFSINGKKCDEYFTTHETRRSAMAPLQATESAASYEVWVEV
jgi:small subunit ribosomal protein S9